MSYPTDRQLDQVVSFAIVVDRSTNLATICSCNSRELNGNKRRGEGLFVIITRQRYKLLARMAIRHTVRIRAIGTPITIRRGGIGQISLIYGMSETHFFVSE